MNLRELRQRLAALVALMETLNTTAEGENRDLTDEEQTQYDDAMQEAEALRGRIARLERTADLATEVRGTQPTRAAGREAPNHNRLPLGDDETRALAHFFRSGDGGGIRHLLSEERGAVGLNLNIPTQRETRAVVDSTMNITTAADGKNIVPVGFVQDVATRKNERMLAESLGVRRVPGTGTTVNYPVEAADPEDFAVTAEQADNHSVAYERDAGNTGLKAFTLVKYTRKLELTEELLEDEDVGLLDYIADRIGRQIAATHNGLLLTEVGANGTALKVFAAAAAIAAGEPEDIVYHDTLGYYLDDGSNAAWVMRHSTFGTIAKLTGDARLYAETPAGSFRSQLLGYPAYYSNKAAAVAASAKSIFFGDWDQVGYREAPELRIIQDPYSVDGLVILKYSFRAVYGVLQAGAIGYGVHPTA